jgi:thiamine-monophosphate kinase
MKELEYITYLEKKFKTKKPVVRGIGDDCAVLEYTRDKYLLLATDMIVEGTHFSKGTPGYRIGWKAVAVNVSDIAAMGGVPRYALVSGGAPRGRGIGFLKEVTRGIDALCRHYRIGVIGGDTNYSPETVFSVTIIGEVEKRSVTYRDGARKGDLLFVTGALGEGKVKHLSFLPRVKEARTLVRNFKVNSMIDLSDGLAADVHRIAQKSKTGARIYKSLIPLSKDSVPVDKAISSGEDFELLFSVSEREARRVMRRMGERGDLPVTLIGEIVEKRKGVTLVEDEGREKPLNPRGYKHL